MIDTFSSDADCGWGDVRGCYATPGRHSLARQDALTWFRDTRTRSFVAAAGCLVVFSEMS